MLCSDLAREGKMRRPGGSPPLLPLVVYKGRRPRTAPVNLGEETEGLSKGLAAPQPVVHGYRNLGTFGRSDRNLAAKAGPPRQMVMIPPLGMLSHRPPPAVWTSEVSSAPSFGSYCPGC